MDEIMKSHFPESQDEDVTEGASSPEIQVEVECEDEIDPFDPASLQAAIARAVATALASKTESKETSGDVSLTKPEIQVESVQETSEPPEEAPTDPLAELRAFAAAHPDIADVWDSMRELVLAGMHHETAYWKAKAELAAAKAQAAAEAEAQVKSSRASTVRNFGSGVAVTSTELQPPAPRNYREAYMQTLAERRTKGR